MDDDTGFVNVESETGSLRVCACLTLTRCHPEFRLGAVTPSYGSVDNIPFRVKGFRLPSKYLVPHLQTEPATSDPVAPNHSLRTIMLSSADYLWAGIAQHHSVLSTTVTTHTKARRCIFRASPCLFTMLSFPNVWAVA